MMESVDAVPADIQQAFPKFRKVCVELTRHHTRQNASDLLSLLKTENHLTVDALLEYILFPLRVILKQSQNRSSELYRDVIVCMNQALNKSTLTRWETFRDLFNCLCLSISEPSQVNTVASVSEELKLEVVKCLSLLMNKADVRCLENLYDVKMLPALGHAVSLLLALVQHEKDRKLRAAACSCICHLSSKHREVPARIHTKAGQIFASFLPGITMTLSKVITGDAKQGQTVICASINTWHEITCLVLGDKYLKAAKESSTNPSGMPEYEKLVVARDEAWVKATCSKLGILIGRLVGVASHSNWRVREAIVKWAESLLCDCFLSLDGSSGSLLEVLVAGVGDEYDAISTACHRILSHYSTLNNQAGRRAVINLLGDNLHRMATQLPRLIRNPDDGEKLASLKLLTGYLALLGDDLRVVLSSCTHLQRLCLALVQVLEFDCSHLSIIQEKNTDADADGGGSHLPAAAAAVERQGLRKTFRHFSDERVLHAVITVCQKLGTHGDMEMLVDHVLDMFRQSAIYRKQAVFILTHVLLAAAKTDHKQSTDFTEDADPVYLVKAVLSDITSAEFFSLPTCINHDRPLHHTDTHSTLSVVPVRRDESTSVEAVNSNITQICLILECIGACAKVLGRGVGVFLIDLLYLVLERVADKSAHVSHAALMTLNDITNACQERCVADLLCANADYLVNSISRCLRSLSRYPHAPTVLSVLITHSNASVLPLVEDLILELLETLDQVYKEQELSFMKVLHTLMRAVRQWFPCKPQVTDNMTNKTAKKKRCAPSEICQFMLDYAKTQREAEDLSDNDDNSDNTETIDEAMMESQTEEEDKKEPPPHVVLIKKVCERCRHLMPAGDASMKIVALDTVAEACMALQGSKDPLLPGDPLSLAERENPAFVCDQALTVVEVIARVSGDFVRQRLVKDVFPRLISLLHKNQSSGLKTGAAYRFTQVCKLQTAILTAVGPLCLKSSVAEHQLYPVMEACTPYLSSKQPPVLQQAAVTAFQTFAILDEDVVWLLLTDTSESVSLPPPHSSCKHIKIGSRLTNEEYHANVQRIWKTLEPS